MIETNKRDDSEVNIDKSNHENIDDDHQVIWDKVNDHNNDLSGTDVNDHSIDDDPMFHLFCHCHL